MAIIRDPERFIPTPAPRNTSAEMRDWLHEEFERLAQALNTTQMLTDEFGILHSFGLLDGAVDSVLIPDAPDFVPAVNYLSGLSQGEFIVDKLAGTIQVPDIPGWLEITLFFSMQQTDVEKDFVVVVHLEVDGVPVLFASASGYIPTQQRNLELALSTVKIRPSPGGETFRLVFQVLDDTGVAFDISDATFRIRYVQIGL